MVGDKITKEEWYLAILTTRPVIGPQSQINEENACPTPSVCKERKANTVKHTFRLAISN